MVLVVRSYLVGFVRRDAEDDAVVMVVVVVRRNYKTTSEMEQI
jgi:hypothetical protein